MKDVKITRAFIDEASHKPVQYVERVYRYRTDTSNFEAVEARDIGADKHLTWVARGTGMARCPVGRINGNVILVRGEPITRNAGDPDPTSVVSGGAGLPIELEAQG